MIKKYSLVLLVSLCFVLLGFGQTFNQVTTLAGLTDGNYLIAADGNTNDGLMLNSTAGSVYIDYTNITNPGATINSGFTGNNIFSITVSGGNITINNSSVGYVSWGRSPATANDADFYNGTVADTERWTPTVSGGLWTLSNVDTSARMLQWNNSSPRFSAYTSNQVKLKLYKQAVTGPAITATPTTITGLDYGFGNGPSTEQSFDVTGTLLVAGTTVTSNSTDFQVSLTAVGGYASSVNIPAGTLNGTTTIYTRLVTGLAINTYSNTISISNATPGIGTTPTINVSGEVTPPQADVVITEIMYNSTGTDDEWIEICNLNGTAQDISNYIIEVNNSTVYNFPASTNIPGNSCITVALGDNGSAPFNPDCPFAADYGSPSGTNILNNSSTTIELIASDGTSLIDTVFYDDADGADGNGSSLHVIDATLDNSNTGTNWQEVIDGGSPGDNILISPCSTIAPEINVEGGGNSIPGDGSNFPVGFNNTLFDSRVIGASQNKIFVINNEGLQNLTISSIVIGGSHPGDFTITGTPPATAIAPGNSENLQITFQPTATGVRTATVTINNNDTDESTFVYNIQGTGTCNPATYTLSPASGPAGTIVTVTATSGSNPNSATALYDGNATTITSITASSFELTIPDNAISSDITFDDATGCQRNIPFIVNDIEITNCQGTNTAPTQIFISEVTDRDSSTDGHSYIELFNGTGATVDISGYRVYIHSNGNGATWTINLPTGASIANNDVYVISFGTGNTNTDPVGENDYFAANVTGINDRDHIYLNNGSSDIDLWGDTSGNPFTIGTGTEYGTSNPNGSDYTYRRKNTVSAPSLTWNPSDWDALAPVNYSDIGNYDFSLGTPPNVTTQPMPPISSCNLTASFTVAGQETYTGTGNSQFITYLWYYSAPGDSGWNPVPNAAPYESGTNTAAILEIINTLNLDGYQYYCQIREDDEYCYTASKAVRINIEKATWTNTGWSSPPASNKIAIIDDDYDTGGVTNGQISFEACNLIINAGNILTISDEDENISGVNTYVSVENNIFNYGEIFVDSKASLVQVNDNGEITLENASAKNTLSKFTHTLQFWYDYTYWSSPLESVLIEDGLEDSNVNRRYIFRADQFIDLTIEDANTGNTSPGQDDIDDNGLDWFNQPIGSMIPGVGYAATHNNIGFTQRSYQYLFEGTLASGGAFNNGPIPVDIYVANVPYNNWNFIGNPYPSAISAIEFINQTASYLEGVLYFWSHYTDADPDAPGNQNENFSQDDYAMFNYVGGVATAEGPDSTNDPSKIPNGYIASGQGFFVIADTNYTGSAGYQSQPVFNNSMRVTGNNEQFFRTTNDANKIWVNLTSDNGIFNQVLIGYVEGATDAVDEMRFDALRNLSTGSSSILYSVIQDSDKKYAIQGKNPSSLTLDEVIPLGFYTSIDVATLYKLSIEQFEGEFFTENSVFVIDNLLNVIHDLSASDYTFTSETGEFNNRFEIVFRDSFLSINEEELSVNNLTIIELQNGDVQFKVPNQYEIKTVEIIDILGRSIYSLKGDSSKETYNLSNLSQATYIAKITLTNGQVITKKAVKRK